jgi:hypothetical protein
MNSTAAALKPANLPDIRSVEPIPVRKFPPHPTKEIFRKHGITGRKLATATGYNPVYLLSILRGVNRPRPELERALYVFADQLEPGRFADRLAEFEALETEH